MKESMVFPTPKEWESFVPMAKFEVAASLVMEARKRRHRDAIMLTPNEKQALHLLDDAMNSLGYDVVLSARWGWVRPA